MQPSRRGWFQRVVAVVVAARIPASWLPTQALRRETALEYLRCSYNTYRRISGSDPQFIDVGRELFDAVVAQMVANARIPPYMPRGPRVIDFTATKVRMSGYGWQVKAIHAA